MINLSKETLRELHENAEAPCVSLYMPTHRAGAETSQNPIRFKNLLKQAEKDLAALGHEEDAIGDLLKPARKLERNFHYWQHQSDGMALFLCPGVARSFRLPIGFEEFVAVGKRFHFTPLLPFLTGDGLFHILALSQNNVRLYMAERDSVREIDLHDIPESLRDAVGYDFEQRSLQFTSGTSAVTGAGGERRRAMFHGHGAGDDDDDELERFLQMVDNGIRELIDDQDAPLVIAAVESVGALYRKVSKHPNVVDEIAEGSPEHLSEAELHERCWKVVEPLFRDNLEKARERWADMSSTDRASAELEEVVPASEEGRVQSLFVALDTHRWGRFDRAAWDAEVHDEREPEDEDLVDRAALACLFHGGEVFAVPKDEVPSARSIAAVYRY